ncbi:MAG: RNA polymerase sigma factor [Ruminococcaceae bacterium]|nr:RNA polymerase sigma factor [Oscillospiraceae bacterium]
MGRCYPLLEKLYMAYKDDIFRYLVSLTHDSQLAEELLSEVFLAALTSLHSFRGDSSEKTWLISIARNTYFNHLRKNKIDLPLDMLTGVYVTDTPLDSLLTREKLERVNEIISSLDEKSRITVKMRAEGYSYKEIAQRLGIAETSARTLEFRAKNKIRTILAKEGLL